VENRQFYRSYCQLFAVNSCIRNQITSRVPDSCGHTSIRVRNDSICRATRLDSITVVREFITARFAVTSFPLSRNPLIPRRSSSVPIHRPSHCLHNPTARALRSLSLSRQVHLSYACPDVRFPMNNWRPITAILFPFGRHLFVKTFVCPPRSSRPEPGPSVRLLLFGLFVKFQTFDRRPYKMYYLVRVPVNHYRRPASTMTGTRY